MDLPASAAVAAAAIESANADAVIHVMRHLAMAVSLLDLGHDAPVPMRRM
jgi:hypothetical protein